MIAIRVYLIWCYTICIMSNRGESYRLVRRGRRLRRSGLLRDMVADVRLSIDDFVLPLFVRDGEGVKMKVSSMPGVCQMSPDVATKRIGELSRAGLKAFILFGVTEEGKKDASGSWALDEGNAVNRTMRMVREAGIDIVMMADLCFCEYTDHGHCGVLSDDAEVAVDNDKTLAMIGELAVVQARCGADVVGPSGMMDGQVGVIRRALDDEGYEGVVVMSYSVKYASALYGPFRDAGEGSPRFGDRRGYQMDCRRGREWRMEVEADIAEGADIVMVKPGVHYLDIVQRVREAVSVPVAVYHVSGEYSMIHAAAEKGWIDLQAGAIEATVGIKRAGADLILTYFAADFLEWLG